GQVHDAAAALLHHRPHRRLAEVEGGGEIHLEHAAQIVRLVAHDEAVDADAGVVHQHVDAAQLGHHRVDGPRAGFGVAHVELDQVNLGCTGALAARLGLV